MNDQQRIETAAENCEVLRARLARYEDAQGVPVATIAEQDREIERLRMQLVACGVVALANTPESAAKARDMHPDYMSASCGDVIRTVDIQMQLRAELAALKAQPSGVVQWPDADEIMQMAFEEGQPGEDASGYYFELEEFDLFIQRLMEEVARLNQSVSAGGVDERVPDVAGIGRDSGHPRALVIYLRKEPEDCDIRTIQECLRQARAALSAPSHGEQVREVVPAGWKLVPVEPTPEMLAAGDKYIGTPATYKAMLSACPSPAITKDFSQFLSAVMDAAGLIRHGRQSKELSEYLGMKCMEYRGVAPSAGSQEQGE